MAPFYVLVKKIAPSTACAVRRSRYGVREQATLERLHVLRKLGLEVGVDYYFLW